MPSSGFEPRPYGTEVSVIDHYTGCTAITEGASSKTSLVKSSDFDESAVLVTSWKNVLEKIADTSKLKAFDDDFTRGRIIGKIEEGRKITDVAREFDIAHSVVSRLWKSFKTTGMCSRRHGGGRVRSTTPAEDGYIVLSAKGTGAPQLSRWQISFLLPQESRSPEKLLPDV
ncbi:uncharacterized protein TNCV_3269591 [Trichonephila clavipes]|nr:uncharacterized protein TNCV_3269591 [Trichonephila clavipes]